jgi:hypothetical protein
LAWADRLAYRRLASLALLTGLLALPLWPVSALLQGWPAKVLWRLGKVLSPVIRRR